MPTFEEVVLIFSISVVSLNGCGMGVVTVKIHDCTTLGDVTKICSRVQTFLEFVNVVMWCCFRLRLSSAFGNLQLQHRIIFCLVCE